MGNSRYPERIDTDPGTPWLGRLLAFLYNRWPWYRSRFQRNLDALIEAKRRG